MQHIHTQTKTIAVLSLLGILSFFGTLKAPFVYDDLHAIVENPYIRSLWDFQNVVGIENIFNRSVVLLTYAVNRETGGLNVFGFHLANLLIHTCAGIALYFLTAEWIALETVKLQPRLKPLPALTAAISLVHPMAVEPVTYLASRSSILATLFFLLGFFYFIQSLKLWQQRGPGLAFYSSVLLTLTFFFLGAGSKEIIVTLPVLAIAYVWFKFPRLGLKKMGLICGLVFLPLGVYLSYRYMKMGHAFTLNADPDSLLIDRGLYLLTQVKALVFYYLWKLVLPFNFNFEPDMRLVSGIADPEWMAGLGFMMLLAAALHLQESRLLRFGFLWALIAFLPTSSLIPLKQIVTEHRAYLPAAGIALALGLGLLTATRRHGVRAAAVAVFLLLAPLLTLNRTLDYRTEVALWQDTAKKSPNKALVHNNLAAAYLGEKKYAKAREELKITLGLDPEDSDAYINLGHIHSQKLQWEKARMEFDRAILLGSPKADAFYNAGLVRTHLNQTEEALLFFRKALDMKPQQAKYHFELGNALRSLNRFDEALQEYRLTVRNQPGHLQAYNNMGVIFWTVKNYPLAEEAFQKALALGGDTPEIHNNLASLYMIREQYPKAIPHLERLTALQPENAKAGELLKIATTLTEAGAP